MFGWFKGKTGSSEKQESDDRFLLPLSFSQQTFVEHVSELIENSDTPTVAMSLVAFENIKPMLAVFSAKAEELEQEYGVEDLIRASVDAMNRAPDEISLRKPTWFYLGALLLRAHEFAVKKDAEAEEFARVWVRVSKASIHLRALLPDNKIWDSDEKMFFWHHYNDSADDFICFVVNHCVPRSMNSRAPFAELAKERDLFFIPGPHPFVNPVQDRKL